MDTGSMETAGDGKARFGSSSLNDSLSQVIVRKLNCVLNCVLLGVEFGYYK